MSRDFDCLLKLLLVGNSHVGKTAILDKYARGKDLEEDPVIMGTIGVDFAVKHLTCDNMRVKLQIWDTSGHPRSREIVTSYFRGANGVILAYDITNGESFTDTQQWAQDIADNASGIPVVMIVVRNFEYQYQHCLLPAGPVSIKSTSKLELESRSPCSTISFIGTPEVVLFGCGSVLNAYDHKLRSINGVVERHSKPLAVVVMVPQTTDIFFIDSAGSVLSTVFGAFDDLSPRSFTTNLFSVEVNAELTLAANENYLVVSNVKADGKDDGHWLIYNRKSKSKRMYQQPRYDSCIRALKFHPDGDLIALTSHGHVCKFELMDDGQPFQMWSWYGGATAICVDDKRGLVYAAGYHGELYAIADGQSVGCIPIFSNDGAPSDMAAYNDMLLISYGGPNELRTKDSANEVSVFTLKW